MILETLTGRRISIDLWEEQLHQLDSFDLLLLFLDANAEDGDESWASKADAVCSVHHLVGLCLRPEKHRLEMHELMWHLERLVGSGSAI